MVTIEKIRKLIVGNPLDPIDAGVRPNQIKSSKSNKIKEVATLTVRQDPDEPQLKMRLYEGDPDFYIGVESDRPAIPPFMPMRITPTNLKDAKREAKKFLHIIRGVCRQTLGKTPDLPEDMKEMESEIPAFGQFLLSYNY
jgi:hypothetical protein